MSGDRGGGGPGARWSLTQIGAEMAELVAQLQGLGDPDEVSAAERELTQRLDAVERFAPLLSARDPAEGLVQVLVLASLRHDVELRGAGPESASGAELAQLLRRMDGCLRSLARLLAREAARPPDGLPPGALPIEWYLGRV